MARHLGEEALIRRAGPADAGLIARLVLAFGAEFDDLPDPGVEERLAAFLADPGSIVLVLESGLGFVAVRVYRPYWSALPEGIVDDLYVMPEQRGNGFGRALMEAAIAATRALGGGHLELTTTEEDVAAAALYRALGMRETEQAEPGSGRVIWFGLDLA